MCVQFSAIRCGGEEKSFIKNLIKGATTTANLMGFIYFMAKDTFYFTHDYNARNDIKIKKLLSKHGYEGYGIFWALIEDLYNNTNVLRLDYETLSFDLRCSIVLVKSVINDFDLFVIEGDIFGSSSVESRLEARNAKSEKARESVLKRWNKVENNTNVLPTQNDSNTIKESKVKEKKEIKEKEHKEEHSDFEILEQFPFDEFWNSYDKKVEKGACEKKFDKLTEKEKALIWEHVPKYVSSTPDKNYRKNPETYLNNKCWNDEVIFKNGNNGTTGQQQTGESQLERAMAQQAIRKAQREADLQGSGKQ